MKNNSQNTALFTTFARVTAITLLGFAAMPTFAANANPTIQPATQRQVPPQTPPQTPPPAPQQAPRQTPAPPIALTGQSDEDLPPPPPPPPPRDSNAAAPPLREAGAYSPNGQPFEHRHSKERWDQLTPAQKAKAAQRRALRKAEWQQLQQACKGKTNGQAIRVKMGDRLVDGQCELRFVKKPT